MSPALVELGLLAVKLVGALADRLTQAETRIKTIEEAGGEITAEQVREIVAGVEANDAVIAALAREIEASG